MNKKYSDNEKCGETREVKKKAGGNYYNDTGRYRARIPLLLLIGSLKTISPRSRSFLALIFTRRLYIHASTPPYSRDSSRERGGGISRFDEIIDNRARALDEQIDREKRAVLRSARLTIALSPLRART